MFDERVSEGSAEASKKGKEGGIAWVGSGDPAVPWGECRTCEEACASTSSTGLTWRSAATAAAAAEGSRGAQSAWGSSAHAKDPGEGVCRRAPWCSPSAKRTTPGCALATTARSAATASVSIVDRTIVEAIAVRRRGTL
jgi:hypothetical protein